MQKIFLVGLFAIGLTSCSSAPKMANGEKFEADQVLATAGDKPVPQWAEDGELQPLVIKSGKVYSVGLTTLRGDERPEAGVRVAENSARANFAKSIETRMSFIFQGSEENAGFDSVQSKWIGSEVSELTSQNMMPEGRFWKRYAQTQEDGSRRIFYKIYALVTMKEADLKQAIFKAANKGVAQNQLSPDFKKQVDQHWNRFVEGNQASGEARKPTANDSN